MKFQVVISFVDNPADTTNIDGVSYPASALLEDLSNGNRWVLMSGPKLPLARWSQARELGAVGVFRSVPLRYVEQTVFSDRADRSTVEMSIDEKWFIPCTELPRVPATSRPASSYSPFVHLHAHSEFCLAPETLVCTASMVWKKIGDVEPGEVLVGFDEDLRPEDGQRGNSRSKMRPSTVIATKRRVHDCYRITLEDGTSIISSAKHGWVVTGTTRGSLIEPDGPECGFGTNTRRWLTTERLGVSLPDRWGHTKPTRLPKLVKWATPWGDVPLSLQRDAAYLAGILDGEGWLNNGQLAVAQNPGPVLDEIKRCCEVLGYPITDDRVQSSKGECHTFRFAGYETALRVLSQCDPVRFRDRWSEVWEGRRAGGRYTTPVQIVSVEHLGEMETVALTTSTKTFVAEGFLGHNSPLDGLATPEEMIERAAALDQFAIAVTDHGYCAAHPKFQKAALAAGIKPIFGLEANLVRNRHLREDRYDYWHFLLLARNEVGLRNLWGASSEAHIEGFYGRPRMDFDTLARFSEGLIGSTACLRGPLKQLVLAGDDQGAKEMIARLRAIFPESLYLEIHTNAIPEQIELNEALVQLGQEMSLPLVAVCDAHYADDCDHHLHKAWIAAQTDKDLSSDQDLFSGNEHYYLRSNTEVADALAYLGPKAVSEAMANTVEIANACDVTIKQGSAKPVYHRYVAPGFEGATSSGAERDIEVLREKCEQGFAAKRLAERDVVIRAMKISGQTKVETYRDRMERELAVMVDKGFAGYFLIVEDYCNAARQGRTSAKKRLLMGPGRGSVVGSLVAYLIGITQVDPIEADLLFERFITAGRTSPPDIDLDFPSSERSAITDYITDRWGADRVVRVGTHGRLQNKGVFRSLEKVFRNDPENAMAWDDLVKITKIIDEAEAHTAGLGLKWEDLWEQEGDLLEPFRQLYPVIFDYAERMVKRLKSYGRHASGVVIDPENPIVDRLPLRTAGDESSGRQVVTEFDMEALELLGYLKFDILTLRTLDTIQVCLDMIEADEFYGGKLRIDIDSWVDEYKDPQVWDMLCSGDTLGVFQIETSSGTRLVKRMQPRSIADLSAILTLVRPGPMRSGLTDTYIKRRFGEEPVVAIHPLLEPVLGRTYQCMIYQEDIMAVCSTLAGYDLEQSDKVRAILGKKKVEEAAKEGVKFVDRCVERGVERALAEAIWAQMEEFAKYTFNRAHSWSYAVLAYWCAWLKCHFPAHFSVAVLSTIDKKRIPEFVEMSRRNGYDVLPPDVNESAHGFTVSANRLGIRYGFGSIATIGEATSEAIISGQPYSSWDDFIERRGPKCNFGHIRTLAGVGTFDRLIPEGKSRPALLAVIELLAAGKAKSCQWKIEGYDGPNGLPCTFDWTTEVTIGKSGKPLKAKPLPKQCTKACRQYVEREGGVPWPDIPRLTRKQVRDREREVLGVYLSSTPFDAVPLHVWDERNIVYGDTFEQAPSGHFGVYALINSVRLHEDKAGRRMAFVRANSLGYEFDVTVFSTQFERYRKDLVKDTLCILDLDKNDRGATLNRIFPIDQEEADTGPTTQEK